MFKEAISSIEGGGGKSVNAGALQKSLLKDKVMVITLF